MFEHAVIEGRPSSAGNRFLTLPVSVSIHTVLIGAALFAAVWNIDFPAAPPHLMELLRPANPPPAILAPPKISRGSQPEATRIKNPTVTPRLTSPPKELTAPVQAAVQASLPADTGGVHMPGVGHPDGNPDGNPLGDPNGDPAGLNVAADPIPITGTGPRPVGGSVKAPIIVERVSPVYPELARRIRKEGIAVVECIIDKTGGIRDVRLIASDFPSFGDAALASVRRWKFRPGTLNGTAVDTVFQLTIRFNLN